MEKNTIEVMITARDEASRTLHNTIAQVQAASQAASLSSQALARGSDQAGQAVQGFARAAQRASRDVTDWSFLMGGLTPQLATASITTLQLTNAVAEMGTRMGLVTGGIALVVAAGFKLVSMLEEAERAEKELTDAIHAGTIGPITARITKLDELLAAHRTGIPTLEEFATAFKSLFTTGGGREEQLEERVEAIRKLRIAAKIADLKAVEEATHAINRQRFEAEKKQQERLQELDGARIRGIASTVALEGRLRVEAEHEIGQEALGAYEAFLVAKDAAARESARRQLEINAKLRGDLQRAAVQAEGEISETQGAGIAAAQFEFEERTLQAIQRSQQPIVNAMTTLGNASADALFDALSGRARNLGETLKSLFDGLARDIFRNTLAQLFGGKGQGLSLQNLLSLGGGGSPFGRVALAAGMPGAPASIGGVETVIPGAAAVSGRTPLPGFGNLVQPPSAGLTFGQFAGGVGMVGLGALGILGASQAQDPFSGAISGGLGGLGVGLGLAQLGLGAGAVLGPIGLVAGLAFGIFAGAGGRRRRRREERRRQRAAAQIALLEAADTMEELERLSGIGLEPEAQEALRQRATPLILAAGREEIGRTTSLVGIQAILARGVSPDVGGLELRAEAERRRQEILGGLEEIGGISIEEQLEGGVRRRTLVGAGAFGLARAAQAGRPLTIDRSAFRRALREQTLEDHAYLEQLLFRLRSIGQSRDIRIGDLDALSYR